MIREVWLFVSTVRNLQRTIKPYPIPMEAGQEARSALMYSNMLLLAAVEQAELLETPLCYRIKKSDWHGR